MSCSISKDTQLWLLPT